MCFRSLFRLASLALAINTFFRKSFRFEENFLLLLLLLFLSAASGSSSFTIGFCVITVGFILILDRVLLKSCRLRGQDLLMRNVDRQDVLNFLATLSFVHCAADFAARLAGSLSGEDERAMLQRQWSMVPVLSLLQICRNPRELRDWLRPLRVACGPASILAAVTMGAFQATSATCDALHFPLAVICSASSGLAGFVFRPDNGAVLQLFPIVAEHRWVRGNVKKIHAYLNLTAVACSIAAAYVLH